MSRLTTSSGCRLTCEPPTKQPKGHGRKAGVRALGRDVTCGGRTPAWAAHAQQGPALQMRLCMCMCEGGRTACRAPGLLACGRRAMSAIQKAGGARYAGRTHAAGRPAQHRRGARSVTRGRGEWRVKRAGVRSTAGHSAGYVRTAARIAVRTSVRHASPPSVARSNPWFSPRNVKSARPLHATLATGVSRSFGSVGDSPSSTCSMTRSSNVTTTSKWSLVAIKTKQESKQE